MTPPDPADPDVELWRDLDGRVGALADRRGETFRLHLPTIATFEFELADDEVVVRADPRASRETIVDQFHRTAVPLVLQARGHEVLHASAVRSPRGIVVLCATKESGKSTLACALAARGYTLWADDAVVFTSVADGLESIAVPFRLRLRPASAEHFGRPARSSRSFDELAEWTLERAPIAAVIVLVRQPGPRSIELLRLDPGAALTALLAHGYSFSLRDEERKAAMLRQYLALAAALPILEFRYPTGLEHLDEMVDRLEEEVVADSRDRRS